MKFKYTFWFSKEPNVIQKWIGRRRNVVALMGLCSTTMLSILRINLNIAIVAMTRLNPVTWENGTVTHEQEFEWSYEDKGKILSSFFYGYTTMTCLGGWVGARYGGVKVIAIGLITSSLITTFLLPIFANNDIRPIMGLRILLGVAQGFSIPSMVSIWSQWATPDARARLVTFSLGGISLGSIVGMVMCGFLSDYFGWRSIFYVTGGMSFLWSIIWFSFVREKPKDDPWITDEELSTFVSDVDAIDSKALVYPFNQIFTSIPFLSLMAVGFLSMFGNYTLQMELPSFFNDVFNFDLSRTGLLAALPDLFLFFSYIGVGNISDRILKRGVFSTTQVRKLFICSALSIQSISAILVTLTTNPGIMIFLFTMIKFLSGFSHAMIDVNPMDMAPQYAGFLFGVLNVFGQFAGSLAPMFCGYVVTNKNLTEWNTVFATISFFYLLASIIYKIFGSAELQPWALSTTNDVEKEHVLV